MINTVVMESMPLGKLRIMSQFLLQCEESNHIVIARWVPRWRDPNTEEEFKLVTGSHLLDKYKECEDSTVIEPIEIIEMEEYLNQCPFAETMRLFLAVDEARRVYERKACSAKKIYNYAMNTLPSFLKTCRTSEQMYIYCCPMIKYWFDLVDFVRDNPQMTADAARNQFQLQVNKQKLISSFNHRHLLTKSKEPIALSTFIQYYYFTCKGKTHSKHPPHDSALLPGKNSSSSGQSHHDSLIESYETNSHVKMNKKAMTTTTTTTIASSNTINTKSADTKKSDQLSNQLNQCDKLLSDLRSEYDKLHSERDKLNSECDHLQEEVKQNEKKRNLCALLLVANHMDDEPPIPEPKKPRTALRCFMRRHVGKLRKQHPQASENELKATLTEMWEQASSEVRSEMTHRAEQDKLRYDREVSKYEVEEKRRLAKLSTMRK